MPTKITSDEAITLVVRDVAWRLRAVSGSRPINILSGPTTTTKLAYFGDTQGLGTLYWENLPGLKSAAAIFGAKDEEEARRLCRKHSVTHIVVFSWDAFAEPYARLHHARPLGATTDDCFANALIEKRDIPAWLNPLPYEMIPELERAGHWVLICEVLSD